MQLPYVNPQIRERFDAWLQDSIESYSPPLTFTEMRKGVQAVVRLGESSGVKRRKGLLDGQGKRAALATYFAALHYMTVHHAMEMLPAALSQTHRVIDLGCASGAIGAAIARDPGRMKVVGIDRSGWAKEESERTWRAFGLEGSFQRVDFPVRWPALRAGDLISIGWQVAGLGNEERRPFVERIQGALRRGCSLVMFESMARADDHWNHLAQTLTPFGVEEVPIRVSIHRPDWIRRMDTAARLDHQVVAARVLFRAARS